MNGTYFVWQVLRITLALSVTYGIISFLLNATNSSSRTRVIVWMFSLVQCWMLVSFVVEVPWYEPTVSVTGPVVVAAEGLSWESNMPRDPTSASLPEAVSVDWWPVLQAAMVAVWLGGISFLVVKYVREFRRLRKAVSLFPSVAGSNLEQADCWITELGTVVKELEIVVPIDFRFSEDVGPLVCRVNGSYVVVTPVEYWQRASRHERVAILRHELSHIRRCDPWLMLCARILVLPQWFNPVSWLALRQLDESIEMACDDDVLALPQACKLEYAKAIVSLLEFKNRHLQFSLAADGPPVQQRIQRIVQPKGAEMKFARMLGLLSLFVISLFCLFRMELVAQEPSVVVAKADTSVRLSEAPTKSVRVNQEEGEPEADWRRYRTKSYYVGDLILSEANQKLQKEKGMLLGGITTADFQPLIELIKGAVDPDSWSDNGNGGEALIAPYVKNLSLVISHDPEAHGQIVEILGQLRELNSTTLTMDALFVLVPRASKIGDDIPASGKVISKKAVEAIRRETAKLASGNLLSKPKVTLYSGQYAAYEVPEDWKMKNIRVTALMVMKKKEPTFELFCSEAPPKTFSGPAPVAAEVLPIVDGKTARHAGPLKTRKSSIACFDLSEFLIDANPKYRAIMVIDTKILKRELD